MVRFERTKTPPAFTDYIWVRVWTHADGWYIPVDQANKLIGLIGVSHGFHPAILTR